MFIFKPVYSFFKNRPARFKMNGITILYDARIKILIQKIDFKA